MEYLEKFIDFNKTELLIFDCDGTLMDTVWAHYKAWNDTYSLLGCVFVSNQEFVDTYAGTSGDELVKVLNHQLNYCLDVKKAIALKDEIFVKNYINKVKPFEKTLNIIKKYYGVLPLIVASGGETEVIRKMLAINNLTKYFVDIITINDVKLGKPEPDLFLEAAIRHKVAPENCLVFEDSEAGFQAARNANMKFIDIDKFEGKSFINEINGSIKSDSFIEYKIYELRNAFSTHSNIMFDKIFKEINAVFLILDSGLSKEQIYMINNFFDKFKIKYNSIIFESGEENKNITNVIKLITILDDFGVQRRSQPIVAIGGGVLTDLAGFVASIYRRGIPCIKIPTTLMGYIDASIGIKTGINFNQNKNRIGSFASPLCCILDSTFLRTLPDRELINGVGEIIKLGVIKNKYLFELLENHGVTSITDKFQNLLGRDILNISINDMIEELKYNFLELDLERIVDFGHTFSLVIEMSDDENLLHGEAVAVDILISSIIAFNRNLISISELSRIKELIKKFGLPISTKLSANKLYNSLQERVLHRDGYQRVPLPNGIGNHVFVNDINIDEISLALKNLNTFNRE
ncbi:HAD-IA family hydrolase [Silvanigrella paludirubra]|uniref:HAD-IA family hydrolase n=1 Tax=Silvanigrella paludirubra TaxID=2499159 RepID=A0A6N6VRY2_9BACT|nr:HAD-IA family hydrolase [Silvanigrella paludirubra]KAB8038708.1 HAD-IA family hydrolase [Silvanigrella paludirubra]